METYPCLKHTNQSKPTEEKKKKNTRELTEDIGEQSEEGGRKKGREIGTEEEMRERCDSGFIRE